MTEKPILFNGEMVRATLDGRKTQIREVIKPHPAYGDTKILETVAESTRDMIMPLCPYGVPGGHLWVREAWCRAKPSGYDSRDDGGEFWYRATDQGECDGSWRPSVHMPRAASRILLEVTDVQIERLNCISEGDAMSEGVDQNTCPLIKTGNGSESVDWIEGFRSLWDSIYEKRGYGWDTNPFCWRIRFKRLQ